MHSSRSSEVSEEQPGALRHLGRLGRQIRSHWRLPRWSGSKGDLWRRYGFSLVYYALGRRKEADATLSEFVKNYQHTAAFQIAEVYAYRGEVDRAFEWLKRAYAQRDSGLSQMKGHPHFKRLERDPRFAVLLEKMRLPP